MTKSLSILLTLVFPLYLFSQDINYARKIMDTLSSGSMHGRGYVDNGDKIAAKFISKEFSRLNLNAFEKKYFQKLSFPINTLPGKLDVSIDGKILMPGVDFLMDATSTGQKGSFELIWLLAEDSAKRSAQLANLNADGRVLITDEKPSVLKKVDISKFKGIIYLKDSNLVWSVSQAYEVKPYFSVDVLKSCVPKGSKTISVDFDSRFFKKHKTQNVIAYIPGSIYPDSFIVFCAHYDHLGRMGAATYFPGANDNASGTAMIMNLANYYSKAENKPSYSIAFMAFAGEEAGLIGSKYFTRNPYFPLSKIKYVINFDMVGTGSGGIAVVNGLIYNELYLGLKKINDEHQFLKSVDSRGESTNSDHYFFHKNGVKSIFIYTRGQEHRYYHHIKDISSSVPLTEYEDLFRLITIFVKSY